MDIGQGVGVFLRLLALGLIVTYSGIGITEAPIVITGDFMAGLKGEPSTLNLSPDWAYLLMGVEDD